MMAWVFTCDILRYTRNTYIPTHLLWKAKSYLQNVFEDMTWKIHQVRIIVADMLIPLLDKCVLICIMLLVAINLKYGITRFWENWALQGMSHNVKLSVLECVNDVFSYGCVI